MTETLSDKIWERSEYSYEDCTSYDTGEEYLPIEDVKQFIKDLKETIKEGVNRTKVLPLDWCFDRIDELAGDKLVE